MKKILFLIIISLSGCVYYDGCISPLISVVSNNCEKNKKGTLFPSIAHYQKINSIGKTNSKKRWEDAISCGAKYGDEQLQELPNSDYDSFIKCMESKGYKRFWPAECGYQEPKYNKGKCNL
ncbi:hypothetical protein QV06_03130 [Gallibacterium genomosp. 3]|uniref:Lipoprotein n=1 Tax=Gallibacterium genomosp. 3 TaxID=505345 RepID=A0A1A7PU13_9PAST|nr:hypothetical protein [Gallibacterium genomosp. 3]OBX05212.1 hypothetical protein QV06_03130 [Gallibacterium genomosp. 3]